MPQYGKGGFGSWTKTGRNIQLGRALGEGMARQSGKSKGDSSCCVYFIFIILILILIDGITKVKNMQIK